MTQPHGPIVTFDDVTRRLGLPTGVYLILIAVQDRPDRPSGSLPWETGRMVAQAAQGATNLAFLVLWPLGGIFTSPDRLPDTLAAIAPNLPSYGAIQVGQAAASGNLVPASALAVLAAWTAGAGALAALAWRRVVAR